MHVLSDSSMHTHNFLVNESYQWHVIKALIKRLPKTNFVSSLDFIEETINSSNGLGFVVTSKNDDLIRISNFQCEEETNDLA